MKKILSLSLLLLACGASFAQTQKTAPTTAPAHTQLTKTQADYRVAAQAETDKMDKALNLSPDQKAKLNNINFKMAMSMERAKYGNSDVALKHYADNKDQMYKQVLTADQYNKYKEMQTAAK